MESYGQFCWITSKLTLLTLALLLSGAIIFWLFAERKGVIYEILDWPQEVQHSLLVTYFYLVCSYLLTILSVAYVFQSPGILDLMATHPRNVVVTSLIIMTVLTALLEYLPYAQKVSTMKNTCWILHSIAMGPAFCYFGAHINLESAIKTSYGVALGTLISLTAPPDFYIDIKEYLQTLYSVVTITSILCFLFNPPVTPISVLLLACNLCGGIILYFGVFITNTQYMLSQLTHNNYDPIYTAAVIYLCTLNFYLRVAMFHVVEYTGITCKTRDSSK